jgi:hypothetical protein
MEISKRGRPELVGGHFKEADMKQIDDLALENERVQTTFIRKTSRLVRKFALQVMHAFITYYREMTPYLGDCCEVMLVGAYEVMR